MSAYNSFTIKASASTATHIEATAATDTHRTAAITPSASTTSIMTGARILRNSDVRSVSTLAGAAKAVTSFLIEGVQLPKILSHYAGFFTGFLTGALGGFALYTYLHRNNSHRAKIKLAVFHILHVIQHGPDYNALLQDPQALLKRIEAEVMRLVDVHLSKIEATHVTKEAKRSYVRTASEEPVYKRVREDVRGMVKERMGQYLAPAYEHSSRGFLDMPVTEQPYNEYEPARPSRPAFNFPDRFSFLLPEVTRYDTQEQPDTASIRRELGLADDEMDVDVDDAASDFSSVVSASSSITSASSEIQHVPSHLFGGTSRPLDGLPTASSAQQSVFIGRVNTSAPSPADKDDGYEAEVDFTASLEPANSATRVTEGLQGAGKAKGKKREGYGLDYGDEDLYPPDSSSDDEDLPASGPRTVVHKLPPTVVRKLKGEKCSGTRLSPAPGSPSINEGPQVAMPFAHWSTTAELVFSSSESEGEEKAASFAVDMSTQPELEYSSSEHGSEGETPGLPVATTTPSRSPEASPEPPVAAAPAQDNSVFETVEGAEGSQTSKSEVDQENAVSSSSPRKRKSPSPSVSPPTKRVRSSSPLADVTNSPTSPSPYAPISASPNKMPFKAGRGRGRTGSGPVIRSPAQKPTTRKSLRLEAKSKKPE